ncbi:nitroreductase family protein [Desulfosudis oleivorans]|uniref:Putative nitroreductase TM1586 domain-containing protein n=1 Tax=Desulfosudis oleivorans (strain DSM 6200 / JCM 39069 / Hxd3) TaxID=96561 RepID=A8ZZM4_DESOH|nr:nitroreductase family protein [Desulfosudis oleivorans]ABW68896.1 conserved hypothetical protein [Desulfosudis oleivorans Hxd3]
MDYQSKATDLIRNRCSWRSFGDRAVETEKRNKLDEFIKTLESPLWGNMPRVKLLDMALPGKGRVSGTYGIIKGAGVFLVGAIKPGYRDMEDFAYIFEKIILCATDLNLATCWMGLTFARGLVAEKIGLAPDEMIPAISPLGYPAKRRALADRIARLSSGSAKRKPWKELFFQGGWQEELTPDAAGAYQTPLEMVRLAPSATNQQPWRIVKQGNVFHFFLQRSPGYDKLAGSVDMQRLDMGIAMCHFELTTEEVGLEGEWIEKEPDLALPKRCEYLVSWKGN